MHKNATKCNETIGKWCKNKHGASKIIDTFETYQWLNNIDLEFTELAASIQSKKATPYVRRKLVGEIFARHC
jgi:hypothetical protein